MKQVYGVSRPSVLEMAVWAWAATAIFYWVSTLAVQDVEPRGIEIASLILGLAVVVILLFGCWKFRQGVNGWRIAFTVLSSCYVVLVPFGLVDPTWGTDRKVASVVIAMLGLVGLVCAWLPPSNWYFREVATHRQAVNAQRFAEFMRNNPPPASVRKKMARRQQSPPQANGPGQQPPQAPPPAPPRW